MTKHETIVILDFGGQYTQLIARRVRENHVCIKGWKDVYESCVMQ